MATLTDAQNKTWRLEARTTIGRDESNNIPLADRFVSRAHAEIRRTDDGFHLVDLGSSYGTFVGGERVKERLLTHGDEVQVGITKFRFEQAVDESESKIAVTSAAIQARADVDSYHDVPVPEDSMALRRAYERMRATLEVSRVMAAERELEPLLERIAETVLEFVRCDRVAALLVEHGTLVPRLARERGGGKTSITLSQTILDEVSTTRQAILSADAGSDARFESAQSVVIEGIRSAMCVPLLAGDELIGALHVDSLMSRNAFTSEDLQLITVIGAQVALAIQNFRLIKSWNDELQKQVDLRTNELREAQELLLTTQRAAAMSSLGAGISHEINNPLTGILGMTQLLKRKAEGSQERMLGTIESEALRIQEIVQTIQRMTEDTSTYSMRPIDLNELLKSAGEVVQTALRTNKVALELDLFERLPQVPADRASLQEAVLHVMNNAIAAMPKGGILTLKSRSVDDKIATVTIRDTGTGMSSEVLERIFDPFFTTKAEWNSKGLGLPVAYRILQEHNGRIRVESELGEGTTVTLQIPIVSAGAHLV